MQKDPSEGWLDANGKRWFRTTRDAVYACHAITSPTVLAVALRLVEYGADAFPSIATLAHFTRLKERSVRSALRKLEQAHVITTRRTGRSNHYSLFCNVRIPDLGRFEVPGPTAGSELPSDVSPSSVPPDRHVVPITPESARSARGADQRGAKCRSDRHVMPPKQGGKLKSKRVAERAARARPAPAPLFFDFEGWECSPALRAELIGLGIRPDRVTYRLRRLKNSPINGGKGCRSLDDYVRDTATEFWVTWEAERDAKAASRAGNAVSSAFAPGGGPSPGLTWEPAPKAGLEGYCARWKLDLVAEAAEWKRQGHPIRLGGGKAADEGFKQHLMRRAKDEDLKRNASEAA